MYLSDLGAAKKLQTRLSCGPCDFGSFVRLATFVGSPAAMAPVRPCKARPAPTLDARGAFDQWLAHCRVSHNVQMHM